MTSVSHHHGTAKDPAPIKAAFTGGPADGCTADAPYSPVLVTMIDGEPRFPPREPGLPADRLLGLAWQEWWVYRVVEDAEPGPDGSVPFICTGPGHRIPNALTERDDQDYGAEIARGLAALNDHHADGAARTQNDESA